MQTDIRGNRRVRSLGTYNGLFFLSVPGILVLSLVWGCDNQAFTPAEVPETSGTQLEQPVMSSTAHQENTDEVETLDEQLSEPVDPEEITPAPEQENQPQEPTQEVEPDLPKEVPPREPVPPIVDPAPTPELRKFSSAGELLEYLNEQSENRYDDWGYWMEDEISLASPEMESPSTTGSEGDFSETNIQEEGVGESDVVKTDGEYLYILDEQQLHIVSVVPADQMEVVASLDLQHSIHEMYLKDNLAIILGSENEYEEYTIPGESYTRIKYSQVVTVDIVDLQVITSPRIVVTYELEGRLNTSRLIDSSLHIVTSTSPWYELCGTADISLEQLMPDITATLEDNPAQSSDMVSWDEVYHLEDPTGYEMIVITSIDVNNPQEPPASVAAMGGADTVYVSTESMYLAHTYHEHSEYIIAEWGYPHQDPTAELTALYKFELASEGAARLVASGSMPGHLLNRFSLSEYQGFLRTATTIGQVSRSGDGDATNNVYVLEQQGQILIIVGRVEEIAPTEKIYSARFQGDRGYLVTFKKVDPLFTLDLSKPTSPQVIGELKVPGYSDYIHPLGEDHLLTIGKDAVDVGDFAWFQGVQLSIFDVTEFSDPQQVDVEITGDRGTSSEALINPHAFNYYPPVEMLAAPMSIYEKTEGDNEPSSFGTPVFEGICLFHIDPSKGIEPVGQISTGEPEQYYYYYHDWSRGIFIGDHIYAVTKSKVQSLPLDDLGAPPSVLILP